MSDPFPDIHRDLVDDDDGVGVFDDLSDARVLAEAIVLEEPTAERGTRDDISDRLYDLAYVELQLEGNIHFGDLRDQLRLIQESDEEPETIRARATIYLARVEALSRGGINQLEPPQSRARA